MGMIRWIAAKLGRQPAPTERAEYEPSEVVSATPSDEDLQEAATTTAAKPRPRRDAGKLQKELDRYLADCAFGGLTSVLGFRDLLDFLLRLTVIRPHTPAPCLAINFDRDPYRIIGRVPLNDGRFLGIVLAVTAREPGRLTVWRAKFQYEDGSGADEWIFRYDYHGPGDSRPPHYNLNPAWWARHKGLRVDTHTPRPRQSLEQVIRILAENPVFAVPCNEDREVWDMLLKRSERWFVLSRSH